VLYGRIRRVGKVDNRKMLRTKPKAHSRQDDSPQIPQEGKGSTLCPCFFDM
jgi:hypothetical protein